MVTAYSMDYVCGVCAAAATLWMLSLVGVSPPINLNSKLMGFRI